MGNLDFVPCYCCPGRARLDDNLPCPECAVDHCMCSTCLLGGMEGAENYPVGFRKNGSGLTEMFLIVCPRPWGIGKVLGGE